MKSVVEQPEIGKFYVDRLNQPHRFYYILDKSGSHYDHVLWDADMGTIKYISMRALIDYTPFIFPDEGIKKFKLEKRFIKGIFND